MKYIHLINFTNPRLPVSYILNQFMPSLGNCSLRHTKLHANTEKFLIGISNK